MSKEYRKFCAKIGKTFGGKRGEAFVNKVINHDRKFYNNEGKTAGNVVHNVVKKSTGVDTRKWVCKNFCVNL